MSLESRIKEIIRDVPDFPREGIVYKDITPLLADALALDQTLNALAAPFRESPPDLVAGVESRGFIFGTAVARFTGNHPQGIKVLRGVYREFPWFHVMVDFMQMSLSMADMRVASYYATLVRPAALGRMR